MIRDPLYRKIVDGLKGPLDGELFEQCAADLLREYEPGLVPIRGGSDRGMDGAILDGDGSAYPLVATTQENVIGNLTGNLKRYLKVDGSRRKVQLATSRLLTTKRRQNLEKRAAELGFELVQIYDQAAMADRLYYAPHWCQELLNLAGDPPAAMALAGDLNSYTAAPRRDYIKARVLLMVQGNFAEVESYFQSAWDQLVAAGDEKQARRACRAHRRLVRHDPA